MAGFPEVVRWIEDPHITSCGHESVKIWGPNRTQLWGNTHPILYPLYKQLRITSDHKMIVKKNGKQKPMFQVLKLKQSYGGFHKWGYPQIIHFDGIFPYKPTILGYPIYGNPHVEHDNTIFLGR